MIINLTLVLLALSGMVYIQSCFRTIPPVLLSVIIIVHKNLGYFDIPYNIIMDHCFDDYVY